MADRTEMGEMKATNLFKVALHLDCGGCRKKEFNLFSAVFPEFVQCKLRGTLKKKNFGAKNGQFKSI